MGWLSVQKSINQINQITVAMLCAFDPSSGVELDFNTEDRRTAIQVCRARPLEVAVEVEGTQQAMQKQAVMVEQVELA